MFWKRWRSSRARNDSAAAGNGVRVGDASNPLAWAPPPQAWDSWLWEVVALTTAGEDETELARRIISVNSSHALPALVEHARMMEQLGGGVLVCARGSSFNRVPSALATSVLRREKARTKLLAAPDDEQAREDRGVADLIFDCAMLEWARVGILRAEGTRDPQVAALLAASGAQGAHLAPQVPPTTKHPRKRSWRPDAEWQSVPWQIVLLATHDVEDVLSDGPSIKRADVVDRQVADVLAPGAAQALVYAATQVREGTAGNGDALDSTGHGSSSSDLESRPQIPSTGVCAVPDVGSVPVSVLQALAQRELARTARESAPVGVSSSAGCDGGDSHEGGDADAAGQLGRVYARADVALSRELLAWARSDILAGEAARDPQAAKIMAEERR